jgi:hypothetical protein
LIGVKSQLQLAINGLLTVTQDGGSIASWWWRWGRTLARDCRMGVPIRGQKNVQTNFSKNNNYNKKAQFTYYELIHLFF